MFRKRRLTLCSFNSLAGSMDSGRPRPLLRIHRGIEGSCKARCVGVVLIMIDELTCVRCQVQLFAMLSPRFRLNVEGCAPPPVCSPYSRWTDRYSRTTGVCIALNTFAHVERLCLVSRSCCTSWWRSEGSHLRYSSTSHPCSILIRFPLHLGDGEIEPVKATGLPLLRRLSHKWIG